VPLHHHESEQITYIRRPKSLREIFIGILLSPDKSVYIVEGGEQQSRPGEKSERCRFHCVTK